MMIEIEQFHNIDLDKNLTIRNISNNIDEFINIVNESNGKIIFVLDICYLLNFIVGLKNQSKPNHLIDMILFKLSNLSKLTNNNISGISEILILDKQDIIKNHQNLFYLQLETCLEKNNLKNSDSNINKKHIVVYKNTTETIINNVYWNVLEPDVKISSHIGRIKSPYKTDSDSNADSYFNLMKIGDDECFVKKISIIDCVDKNLFDLDNNPGIIIEPIDRLYI
jgi:hypothetical protein